MFLERRQLDKIAAEINITYWNVINGILTPPFINIPAERTGLYNLHHTAYDSFQNIVTSW